VIIQGRFDTTLIPLTVGMDVGLDKGAYAPLCIREVVFTD
jgi:hypothetical protein